MNGQLTCAPTNTTTAWHSIDWRKAFGYVSRIQARIVKAVEEKRWNKAKALQRILTSSFYGKAVAVRRVTENRGKRTPGVDEETWSTPESKSVAIIKMKRHGYKPLPLKRIYIPKSNGKLRPLSIPTMRDRAMQALHLLALDPIAETISDGHSYGFRKERSTHDAIEQCYNNARFWGNPKDPIAKKSAEWILEADIKGCFDNISHDWLLQNVPMDKEILQKWLKAGYMEGSVLNKSEDGTPQGGIISPVLANLALNGMDAALIAAVRNKTALKKKKVNFVRYADDFVITGESKELLVTIVKPAVEAFLAERGLELSPEKTKVTHITEGYDFLGQNVRRYGRKLLIKPSKKNIKAFLTKIRATIKSLATAPQETLIKVLNPMIKGWAVYHRHIVAKEVFTYVDYQIWNALWQWAKRRHPNKGGYWISKRYFHKCGTWSRTFMVPGKDRIGEEESDDISLFRAAATPIVRHAKIVPEANPYDRKQVTYFEKRRTTKMLLSIGGRKRLRTHWKDQNGRCLHCKNPLSVDTMVEHHLHERQHGGPDTLANTVLLHDTCHKQVHSQGIKLHKPVPRKRGLIEA